MSGSDFDALIDAAKSAFWAVDPLHVSGDIQFTHDENDIAAQASVNIVVNYQHLEPHQVYEKLNKYFSDYFGLDVGFEVASVADAILKELDL